MRFLSLLISIQAVLAGYSMAGAEPAAERLVRVLKDVCVAPATPDGILEAGEARASAEGWKLVGSDQTSLPIMHNENGPKISYVTAWDVEESLPSRVVLVIWIVRPSMPGVKHSVCWIVPKLDIARDDLTKAIEGQFGAAVIRDTSARFTSSAYWHFTQEKAAGNCGKQIVVLDQSEFRGFGRTMLMFNDFAYPDDGNWVGARAGTFCRS